MATNASRDTTTGTKYETQIYNFLTGNHISDFHSQVVIGNKRNERKHIVDLMFGGEVVYKKKRKTPDSLHKGGLLVSLKNQNTDGTAELKIPGECMILQDAIDDYGYDSAILVLNGDEGWTWKEEYLSERFRKRMKLIAPDVTIISHEDFIKNYAFTFT
jgi:hypothetical protein